MAPLESASIRNRLLAALPHRVLSDLLPRLRRVEMPLRANLLASDEPIDEVYFPESGWVSLLMRLKDGTLAEVGLVGCEGLVGLATIFGADRGMMDGLVQGPGIALVLDTAVLRRAMEEVPPLRKLLLRYALAFNTQVAMTAACNVRHPLQQRLARWLLMSHDRAGGDEFPMTHEFLSLMLGVRRAGVSVAAARLRTAGLIHYRQGHVQVIDRLGLEQASCGCHHLVQHEFDQLLQPGPD